MPIYMDLNYIIVFYCLEHFYISLVYLFITSNKYQDRSTPGFSACNLNSFLEIASTSVLAVEVFGPFSPGCHGPDAEIRCGELERVVTSHMEGLLRQGFDFELQKSCYSRQQIGANKSLKTDHDLGTEVL